jgi:hypothetical protein
LSELVVFFVPANNDLFKEKKMGTQFTIPDEYHESLRRLLPYMEAPLHSNPQVMESLLIYLKLGGEKMARIAIDAFNMNQRMLDAELRKQLRDQMLLGRESEESNEQSSDEDDDDDDDVDAETDEDKDDLQ